MAFTHVTGTSNSHTGSPLSITLPGGAPTLGQLVLVGMASTVTTSALTVKDANNNVYTVTPNSPSTFQTGAGMVWLAYLLSAPSNASATINISWTGGGLMEAWIDIFNYTQTCFFDKDVAANTGTGSTTISTPSITPTNSGSLLYATAAAGGTITHPIKNATLGVWTGSGGAIVGGDMSEYDLSASSAEAVEFTQTPSSGWSAMAMAFYLSSAVVVRELSLLGCGT